MNLIYKVWFICLAFVLGALPALGQDSIVFQDLAVLNAAEMFQDVETYRLEPMYLIAPAVCIGFGIIALESEDLKTLNTSTQDELYEHQPRRMTLDNYTQYAPAALVYGLNLAGIKGKHNFKDRSFLYASSQVLAAAFVVPLKHIVQEKRPDGSNTQSFPSGHTTTAFSSAQFMYREYKDTNIWLSLSGYPLAVFTGVYRTVNDKHWVSDVVTGAGLGILSTELAYWLYPKISKSMGAKHKESQAVVVPFYQDKAYGAQFIKRF